MPVPDADTAHDPATGRARGITERVRAAVTDPRVRASLRRVRYLPDRLAHPLRRRAALQALATARPESVLFVCHGNIFRSPYAEHAFRAALPEMLRRRIRVESGGFVGPGRGSPAAAVDLAARRGLDLSAHRSSLLTPVRVAAAQLIVVMEPAQQRAICRRFARPRSSVLVLGDLDPEPIETRTVRDPWGRPADVLEDSYLRIERCVRVLADALS